MSIEIVQEKLQSFISYTQIHTHTFAHIYVEVKGIKELDRI